MLELYPVKIPVIANSRCPAETNLRTKAHSWHARRSIRAVHPGHTDQNRLSFSIEFLGGLGIFLWASLSLQYKW